MLDIKESNGVVAVNLKRYLFQNGIKSGFVAEKSGFTKQEFSDMLNGRRIMRASDIEKIIGSLNGIDANYLFSINKEKSKNLI